MESSLMFDAILPRLCSKKLFSACVKVVPKRYVRSSELSIFELTLSTGVRRFSETSRPASLLGLARTPHGTPNATSRSLSLASAFRSVINGRRRDEILPPTTNPPLYFVGNRNRTAAAHKLRDEDFDDAGSSTTGRGGGEQLKEWQVLASVCLERMPIISSPLLSIEREFNDMMHAIERERSLLSDHELNHIADAERRKQMAESAAESTKPQNLDEEIVIETAKDREDKWNEQARRLTLAPRITLADQQNDQRSVLRRLDQKLYLVTKMQLGPNDTKWLFPHAAHDMTRDGSLRDTAERVVTQSFGAACRNRIQFLGNAPVGFYKYKYPKRSDARQQYMGAKVFFFHAQLLEPNNSLFKLLPAAEKKASDGAEGSPTVLDYMWLTRSEMEREMQLKYFQSVNKFLFEFTVMSGRQSGAVDGSESNGGQVFGDISPNAMPDELAGIRF